LHRWSSETRGAISAAVRAVCGELGHSLVPFTSSLQNTRQPQFVLCWDVPAQLRVLTTANDVKRFFALVGFFTR